MAKSRTLTVCEWCGGEFRPKNPGRFCTRACFNAAKRQHGVIRKAPSHV
jgi:hypothetical protein